MCFIFFFYRNLILNEGSNSYLYCDLIPKLTSGYCLLLKWAVFPHVGHVMTRNKSFKNKFWNDLLPFLTLIQYNTTLSKYVQYPIEKSTNIASSLLLKHIKYMNGQFPDRCRHLNNLIESVSAKFMINLKQLLHIKIEV